jgi:hypothetical protein
MCWNHHWDDWGRRVERQAPQRTPRSEALRVSDAERQQVIDQLSRHTADGRLTLEEFEARVDEVVKARTGSDLAATLRELPVEPARDAEPRDRRRLPVPMAIALIVLAIALISEGMVWVLFPLGFWLFAGCRGRRYRDRRDHGELTPV